MTDVQPPDQAATPSWQKGLMVLCFTMAVPLAGVLLINPALMLDEHGHYNHTALTMIMVGISAGFIYGVGFIPRFWLWRWLFGPLTALVLMGYGYWMWFGR